MAFPNNVLILISCKSDFSYYTLWQIITLSLLIFFGSHAIIPACNILIIINLPATPFGIIGLIPVDDRLTGIKPVPICLKQFDVHRSHVGPSFAQIVVDW